MSGDAVVSSECVICGGAPDVLAGGTAKALTGRGAAALRDCPPPPAQLVCADCLRREDVATRTLPQSPALSAESREVLSVWYDGNLTHVTIEGEVPPDEWGFVLAAVGAHLGQLHGEDARTAIKQTLDAEWEESTGGHEKVTVN